MKLVWTAPAIADRSVIYDYIDKENPRAAAELDEGFMGSPERLRSYPEIGRPGRVPGTRELVVHKRYILVYELVGETVFVHAVVHTSRQWPPLSDG